MSGSGVYARDADSMCDFTPLEIPEEFRHTRLNDCPAYRVSMTTRSFPTPPERDVIFKWPRFYDDPTGMLAKFETEGADPFAKGRESKLAKNHRIQKEAAELMQDAYDTAVADGCADDNGFITPEDLLERIGTRIDPEGYEVKPNKKNIYYWAKQEWCPIGKTQIEVEGSRGRTRKMTMFFDAISTAEDDFLDDDE